jgi:O-succinylbenzoate-CoA ligase
MNVNIGSLLKSRAHLSPDTQSVYDVHGDRRFTWREMNNRCNMLAHSLIKLGVRRGDRVALLFPNGIEVYEAIMAAAKIGAIACPLNWRLVPHELAHILNDSGASVLIFDGSFAETATALRSAHSTDTHVQHWIEVADVPQDFAHSYALLLASAPDHEPPLGSGGDDDVMILYTSGTTGHPKGATFSHLNLYWMCFSSTAATDYHYQDVWLMFMPAFHIGGITPFFDVMVRGMKIIIMRGFDAADSVRIIVQEQVTNLIAVPTMLEAMLVCFKVDAAQAKSLRWVFTGGTPLSIELLQSYMNLGINIFEGYGLTESTGVGTQLMIDETHSHLGTAGKRNILSELKLIDTDGRDCPDGTEGEILIRSPAIMKGYWGKPEETANAFLDGWLRTGDIGVRDTQGYLTIRGRIKDMIISGGENIYPAEVEEAIRTHPDVADVAVIGQPSARWGESPVAIIVSATAGLTAADISVHVQQRLARFKQPRACVFVDDLPRNSSGKVLKAQLRLLFPGPLAE